MVSVKTLLELPGSLVSSVTLEAEERSEAQVAEVMASSPRGKDSFSITTASHQSHGSIFFKTLEEN